MRKTVILSIGILLLASCCSTRTRCGRINVSGEASLYYEEKGKGEPLILLHGHSLDTRMWDKQFDEFAQYYHTIRFDFRGYGQSSPQSENFQFTHVEDLITLMDSLHIAKAHIVGLSMGGFVGADMLGLFPDRMLSCVLASGGLRKSKGPSEPMDSIESVQRDREIADLKKRGVEIMKQEWLEGLLNSAGSQREEIREPLRQMIHDWDAWQPLHKEVRVIMGLDAFRAWEQHHPEVPTLLIQGTAPGNHYSEHPWMLDYLPNGKSVLMDDCGHMLNMEQPAQFKRIVLDFLHQNSEKSHK